MRKNKPRIHITVNSVRALPPSPPNKKTFDWDDEVRGFGCYRTSCGDVVFVYQYRMVGMTTTDWAMATLLVLSFVFAYFVVKTLDAMDRRSRIVHGALATSCAATAIALILNFGTGTESVRDTHAAHNGGESLHLLFPVLFGMVIGGGRWSRC